MFRCPMIDKIFQNLHLEESRIYRGIYKVTNKVLDMFALQLDEVKISAQQVHRTLSSLVTRTLEKTDGRAQVCRSVLFVLRLQNGVISSCIRSPHM